MNFDTKVYNNYVPIDQIDKVNTLIDHEFENKSELKNYVSKHGTYYIFSWKVNDIIKTWLPLLPGEIPSVIWMLSGTTYTGVHADTHATDSGDFGLVTLGRTIIIPLETQNTHTISFNQRLPTGYNGDFAFQHIMTLPTINEITEEQYQKYFSFKDTFLLGMEKLSIECAFPWVKGDMFAFDRHRLHTGDNHIDNGVKEKRGIVVWTTFE